MSGDPTNRKLTTAQATLIVVTNSNMRSSTSRSGTRSLAA